MRRMSNKKNKIIPCQRHSGYYTFIAFGWIRLCAKCKKEIDKYANEKNEELREYVDKKFREIGKYEEAIETYGRDMQLTVAIEELSELIK